ncbi:MAG TPA: hypothetical protein VGD67_11205 [Pseudonocardiaceae bacterium]
MVRPERRTRGDLVAVALITVGVLTAGALLWRFGDARATESEPAMGATPAPLTTPAALPPSFAEVWRARSGATPEPVVAGATVVTGDGREVIGRDPFSGDRRWRYARDLDLCTVGRAPVDPGADRTAVRGAITAWSKDPRYCSEVTAIGGDSGRRVHQRNGDAQRDTRILFDGSHVTAVGARYLESWRFDLVRTTQYGAVPAPVNPGKQPRQGCVYASAATAANQVALLERCADGERLTVLRVNPKEAELPEVLYSVVLNDPAALVVSTAAQRTSVLLTAPPRLAVYDDKGNQVGVRPIAAVPPEDTGAVAVADTVTTADAVFWWTGRDTVALSTADLGTLWTVEDTQGPGTLFAGRLLVPMPGELAVVDAQSGQVLGTTPVDRDGYDGPVRMATAGPVVLEQRGDTLVALR